MKTKCWDCQKVTKDFRCKSCLKKKTTFGYSNRPNYNKVIDKGVKLKDVLQPHHKDGSRNYEYLSQYGDKIYSNPKFKQ